MGTNKSSKGRKYMVLVLMIMSMCTIYLLPYLRFYLSQPLQEAMGLVGEDKNYGLLMSVYGIMNVILYIPGGIVADRYSPKKLLVFSMVSSGVLGLWMATWPGFKALLIIHILWGFTTVLTYWSSSVKVVNMMADSDEQGEMFGLLESGRGVVGFLLNMAWVGVLGLFGSNQNFGMTVIVIVISGLMILSGVLLAILLPENKGVQAENGSLKESMMAMGKAFKMPVTYILAAMIFVASTLLAAGSYHAEYLQISVPTLTIAFVTTFVTIRGEGAKILSAVMYSRISKKMGRSTALLLYSCGALLILSILLRVIPGNQSTLWPLLVISVLIAFFTCGCRAVYWAIVDEAGTPKNMVGSVIGVASLIGFLPDTFFYTMVGGWKEAEAKAAEVAGRAVDPLVAMNKMFLFCIIVAVVGTLFACFGEKIVKKHQAKMKETGISEN